MRINSLLPSHALAILLMCAMPAAASHAQTPKPFICMYGHSDDVGVTEAFRKLIPRLNVIEGTSSNVAFIKELRAKDCIYAAHVTNPVSATEDELVALWRAPFENDLGDQLPGGYDAIAIDDLQKKTNFFGDGDTKQLVTNPRFETLDGWELTAGEGGRVEQFRYESVSDLQADHDDHGWSSHGTHGLKMLRGKVANRASFEVTGLDTRMVYVASAWVNADKPGRRAGLRITDHEGTVIAHSETDRAGRGTQWNEWTRRLLSFAPTGPHVRIELHDAKTEPGTVLYWDFVELEAFGTTTAGPDSKETIVALKKLGAKLRFDKHGRVLEVNLQETNTKDRDLAPLKNLQHVNEISLHRTKITNTGLERLSHLTRLEKLYLTDTRIDDRALSHMSKLSSLRILGLSGTAVSDAGLEHLKELSALESLFLIGTKVSDRGVEKLKSSLPSCDIVN